MLLRNRYKYMFSILSHVCLSCIVVSGLMDCVVSWRLADGRGDCTGIEKIGVQVALLAQVVEVLRMRRWLWTGSQNALVALSQLWQLCVYRHSGCCCSLSEYRRTTGSLSCRLGCRRSLIIYRARSMFALRAAMF